MKKALCLLAFAVILTLGAVDLKPYKTIVCFGDSITHGGSYHKWIRLTLAEDEPSVPHRVLNRGISGNQVHHLLKRMPGMLKEDKPDLVFIMIGTNDLLFTTSFKEKDLPLEAAMKKYPRLPRYEKEMRELIGLLQEKDVKVVLLTPPPYNESKNPEIKQALRKNADTGMKYLSEILKRIAKEKNLELIDVATPLRKNLEENDTAFPRGKHDRVHPSRSEHQIMAECILGKKAVAGPKKKYADAIQWAQAKIQDLRLMESRIPASAVTEQEKIDWMKNWVARLPEKYRKYHEKRIPEFINRKKLYEQSERDIATAYRALYGEGNSPRVK